jgi:hypothetical protein
MRCAWSKVIVAIGVFLVLAPLSLFADTLELRDGRVLHGKYMGGTQAQLRFSVEGDIQTFSVTEIVALTFTGRPAPPAQTTPPVSPAQAAPAPAPAAETTGSQATVPAGSPLLVRMIDSVDSSKNHVGDRFHASLETDLYANNVLVAGKGTDVYGRLAEAQAVGQMKGSAELKLELTDLIVNGRDYPLVTGEYELKGQGRGKDTTEKVGGGAVLGAIIGALAGGGTGAAIGAGVGAGAGGAVQILTHGQQVKVPSETLLEFRLEQPVTLDLVH